MQDTALYLTKSAIAMITLHPLNANLYSYLPTKSSSFYLCYFHLSLLTCYLSDPWRNERNWKGREQGKRRRKKRMSRKVEVRGWKKERKELNF
jgi:hypothetical protein